MKKGFAHILLIIVLAAIAIGTIAFLFVSKQTVITTSPTPEDTINNKSDWESYTNAEYGFSIKHPQKWYAHNDPPKGSGAPVIEKQITLQGVDPNCKGGGCDLGDSNKRVFIQFMNMTKMIGQQTGMSELDIKENENFEAWVKRYLQNRESFFGEALETEVQVSTTENADVAKITELFKTHQVGIYIFKDEQGKKIYAEMYQNYEENKSDFDQILSTFEFVDSKPNSTAYPVDYQSLCEDNGAIFKSAGTCYNMDFSTCESLSGGIFLECNQEECGVGICKFPVP